MKQYAGALLATLDGDILLQQRDIHQGLINSGKITTFGGTVEPGESVDECLRRELVEELELSVEASQIMRIGVVEKRLPDDNEDCDVYLFAVIEVDAARLKLHEGAGIFSLKPDQPADIRMTRACLEAVNRWQRLTADMA